MNLRATLIPSRVAGWERCGACPSARAVQASNNTEGYDASLDDVIAAVDDEPTLSGHRRKTRALSLAGYRDAMTYVLQVAQDPSARVDEGMLKSLHFMNARVRPDKGPGRWRPGEVLSCGRPTNQQVYEGARADDVPALVAAMIEELETSEAPVLVRAAMAHLNLVMVHPFRDGNGRMVRALQTLVLARAHFIGAGLLEHRGVPRTEHRRVLRYFRRSQAGSLKSRP